MKGRRSQGQARARSAQEAIFRENLGLLRRLTAHICRQHRLDPDTAADFRSWALLRIIDSDYAILRAHRGEGGMAAYLRTVVGNLFRDFRNHLWGKWRPSACACRLGTLAVELERLVHRDGFEVDEAIRILANRLGRPASEEELEAIAARLPRRPVRRQELLREEHLGAGTTPLRLLEDRDRRRAWADAGDALQRAIAELPVEDRRILELYFARGLTMAAIARRLRLDQRRLYSRRDRCLGRLRRSLEGVGLGWREVRPLIGHDPASTVFEQIAC